MRERNDGTDAEKSDWGVSTESPDGKTVYLHVLNLPADGVLTLPLPANGKKFIAAESGGVQLALEKAGKGYRIVLPENTDPVDTVVRLTAKGISFMDTILPPHYLRVTKLMEKLTESEQKELIRLLKKLSA